MYFIGIKRQENTYTQLQNCGIFANCDLKKSQHIYILTYLGRGKKLSFNNWKQREKVWFSLYESDSYSAKNVGKILKMESIEVKGINLSKPKKKNAQLLLNKYVGTDITKVGGYGKRCYKYYKLFKKYN